MADDLPNLNALRVFEAAARLLSFKEAAGYLYVTPGAVSQQIKALEEELGIKLFIRSKRGLNLTEAGRELFPVVREAFRNIGDATARLKESDRKGPLTVSVLPSFAAKWLVPRMGRFRREHPEVDLRISASLHLVDFLRDEVDVAIRYGPGIYPDLWSMHLLDEYLFPVCSPGLLEGRIPLKTPDDLRRHELLHDEDSQDWRVWLGALGITDINVARGAVFNDAAMVLQAAMEGQGIAVTRASLVREDLAAGRLVKPFDQDWQSENGYYLVCPKDYAQRPKVLAFRDWLLEEVVREKEEFPYP